jgi:hypothetical protein
MAALSRRRIGKALRERELRSRSTRALHARSRSAERLRARAGELITEVGFPKADGAAKDAAF